jgi:uncharacterized protein YbaR (Trm112 family)
MTSEDGGQDTARQPRSGGVDRRLLELLVCPLTKTTLEFDAARLELVSRAARLAFPIRDGVPLMTLDAARSLDVEPPPVPDRDGR